MRTQVFTYHLFNKYLLDTCFDPSIVPFAGLIEIDREDNALELGEIIHGYILEN